MLRNFQKSTLLVAILLLQVLALFGCSSSASAPEQEIIENAALQLANALPPRYATTEFKITNHFIKEIDNETVFVYETVFKVKDTETGEVLDGSYTQTPDGIINSTFGLVKRGEKWYPMR